MEDKEGVRRQKWRPKRCGSPVVGCHLGLNPGVSYSYIPAASAGPTEREESENEMQGTLIVLPLV